MAQVFSLEKIAKGDKVERARVLYAIAPKKFTLLAAQQGVKIDDLQDVENLVNEVIDGERSFNFNKLFRAIPIHARDMRIAGRNGIKII